MPEKEILYTAHWIIDFESGPVEYQRVGVVKVELDQHFMKLYYDQFSSCYSMTFPIWGKLIKFWLEIER